MGILQFLLSFFLEEYGGKEFEPILNELKANHFDLARTLKHLNPQTIIPIIRTFMEKRQKNCPTDSAEQFYGVTPINNIADKDILATLNGYFSAPKFSL